VDSFLDAAARWLPRWLVLPVGMLLLAVVGMLDLLTGRELGFSIFYLLPVAWVSWRLPPTMGGAMALLGAVIWFASETYGAQTYSHPTIPVWNAAVRLGFFLLTVCAVVRIRKSLERERALSTTDALTELANSRAFYSAASREVERARRSASALSICYIDLDNFKTVNDTQGHLGGDRALKAIGGCLRSAVRVGDVPARLGGDEFAVLLPDTAADGARSVADRMRCALLLAMERLGLGVTFSVGVVTFLEPPASPDELLQQADRVMYAVKRGGKNAVRCETVGPAS